MSDLATLQIRVDASGAIRVVDQFGKSVETAGAKTTGLTQRTGLLGTAMGTLGGIIAAQGIGRMMELGRTTIQTADQMKVLEGRVKLVTSSQEELISTQAKLRDLAVSTRNSYADTVQLFSRFAMATEDLGLEQEKVLRFTELLNMATKVSGASSAEASAALFQLSQGLAAGALRGQEFNSVIEQTPAIARAISEGLGIPISQLRAFANEGKLTADAVITGILRMDKEIRGDFANAPLTVADGWQQLKDAISQTVGQIDRATGASETLAKALQGIGRALDTRFAASDLTIGAFLYRWTGGLIGSGIMADAAGRLAPGTAGDAPAAPRGPSSNAPIVITASASGGGSTGIPEIDSLLSKQVRGWKDALTAIEQVTDAHFDKQFASWKAHLDAQKSLDDNLRDKSLRQFKAGLMDVKEGTDALTESARVFTEQLQLALGRFASDFLRDGFTSLDRFWDQFLQLGRDAIGQVFARSVMESVGDDLRDSLSNGLKTALGFLKANPAVAIGGAAIGGLFAGAASFLNGTSKWERAAEAQQEAARLLAESAQRQIDWTDRFLDFSATETPLERDLRGITRARDSLAEQAFADFNATNGGGPDLDFRALLGAGGGDFNFLLGTLRNYADNFGGVYVTLFEQLQQLAEAFERNAQAAAEATRAQEAQAQANRAATLDRFRESLGLSGLTTLSPSQMFAEARTQFDALAELAMGGDASAIDSLPDAARTLLEFGRQQFASSTRYVQLFDQVDDTLERIALLERDRSRAPAVVGPLPDGVSEYTGGIDFLRDAQTVAFDELTTFAGQLGDLADALAVGVGTYTDGMQTFTGALYRTADGLTAPLAGFTESIDQYTGALDFAMADGASAAATGFDTLGAAFATNVNALQTALLTEHAADRAEVRANTTVLAQGVATLQAELRGVIAAVEQMRVQVVRTVEETAY